MLPRMSLNGKRAGSLVEVSRRVLEGREYVPTMKEFIDEVVLAARRGGISDPSAFVGDEPHPLPEAVDRAHIAGIAEYLSQILAARPPAWVEKDDYFLPQAVYTCGSAARAIYMIETPSAFRRRNLFCGPAAERLTRVLAA